MSGFTVGIAILIGLSQIKDFLGLTFDKSPANFSETISALWRARDTFGIQAFCISVSTLILIVVLRRFFPRFPGLIVAFALTSGTVFILDLPIDTIASRFGELPKTLPFPQLPPLSFAMIRELLPTAFIIAFLAGVESLLSAMVADRMIGSAHRPNAEVLAQGVANIASSLFGGIPATGAIARTATNVRAGGKTPVSGLVHALTVLVLLVLAGPWVGIMAMPALAALLILTAWNMSEPQKWATYLSLPASDRILLVLTCALTVLADLTVAIGVGVALGFLFRLKKQKVSPEDWSGPKHL